MFQPILKIRMSTKVSAGPIPVRAKTPRELDTKGKLKSRVKRAIPRWFWPLGLMTTGVAGAAVVLFRGCWHRNMSWPMRVEGYSYQVCVGCGIKRLFDENTFHGYGAYSYDLHDLIALSRVSENKQQGDERDTLISAG